MSDLPAATAATFEQVVHHADSPVAVFFGASWSTPCRAVAPVLAELIPRYAGRLHIVAVDTDRDPGLAEDHQIGAIPQLLVFSRHDLVRTIAGALPKSAYVSEFDAALADAAVP